MHVPSPPPVANHHHWTPTQNIVLLTCFGFWVDNLNSEVDIIALVVGGDLQITFVFGVDLQITFDFGGDLQITFVFGDDLQITFVFWGDLQKISYFRNDLLKRLSDDLRFLNLTFNLHIFQNDVHFLNWLLKYMFFELTFRKEMFFFIE